MSLCSDLNEVLTPYAQRIKGLAQKNTELKADLADVTNHAVKSAEQLISDKRTADKVPYKYRASQSGKSDRAYDMIVGGTVCFNQLIQNGDFSDGTTGFIGNNGSISASNGVLIFTASSGSGRKNFMTGNNNTAPDAIVGHKYFYSFYVKVSTTGIGSTFAYSPLTNNGSVSKALTANTDTNIIGIRACAQAGKVRFYVYPWGVDSSTTDGTETCSAHDFMIIDLTSMFGVAIADHIYTLEQSQAGAGVALFRSMFPNDYYPYNAGQLVSVAGLSAKEAVGFNRFDKSTVLNGYIINDSNGDATAVSAGKITDYIPVIPKQTYYIKSDQASGAWGAWYDADKNYISGITGYRISDNLSKIQTAPANARYMRLTCFYNNSGDLNTFCVNVSDPARNGEYEPYDKHTYPLDNTLTLRGVPVLKDGKIEFDGDTYSADGMVTRRYAERAYQSGDEALANAITDGTKTVYKLSAPTTETATPYTSPQVVSPYGTEEYISETVCPVGHITEYPDNLRAKIDGLPWDLSMIAPVETTYKATRNYVTGNLLIVNNTLYKVTANIANGGTITPDTNVIATTLSEVISALA